MLFLGIHPLGSFWKEPCCHILWRLWLLVSFLKTTEMQPWQSVPTAGISAASQWNHVTARSHCLYLLSGQHCALLELLGLPLQEGDPPGEGDLCSEAWNEGVRNRVKPVNDWAVYKQLVHLTTQSLSPDQEKL